MIRVLVVDDSAYVRLTVRKKLEADSQIEVIDEARDGLEAVAKVAERKPDVVTLDLEMPGLDGFGVLRRIMSICPIPVIILSGHSQAGAVATLRALRLGAVDFVTKPQSGGQSFSSVCEELVVKIKSCAGANVSQLRTVLPSSPPSRVPEVPPVTRARTKAGLVVIGASTGGPRALSRVVPGLPASLAVGVVVVQHMPAGFTKPLAQRLDELSALHVKEAEHGDAISQGLVLVAPGGYHMTVSSNGTVELDQGPHENGVRPAIDRTMESAVRVYGSSTVGVVLTGMGCDGTRGAKLMKAAGGQVVAEHETTCVVYGMPRCVIEAGVADRVVPLDDVPANVVALVEGYRNRMAGSRLVVSR